MAEIEGIYAKLVLDAEEFHKGIEKAIESVKHFGEVAGHTVLSLAGAGGLLGILGGAGVTVGLANFVHSSFESAAASIKLSEQLGVSVQELTRLQYAAQASNVNMDAFRSGVLRLQRSLGGAETHVTGHAVAFEKFGLKARELAALPLQDQFEKIAEAMKGMSSAEQSAMAFSIFGRSGGAEMLRFLKQGKEGIAQLTNEADRLGISLDEAGAKKIEEAEKASKKLGAAWSAIGRVAAVEVAPVIERIASALMRGTDIKQGHGEAVGREAVLVFLGLQKAVSESHFGKEAADNTEVEAERAKKKLESLEAVVKQAERLRKDMEEETEKTILQEHMSGPQKKMVDLAYEMDQMGVEPGKILELLRGGQALTDKINAAKYVEKATLGAISLGEKVAGELGTLQLGAEGWERKNLQIEGANQVLLDFIEHQQKLAEAEKMQREYEQQGIAMREQTATQLEKLQEGLFDITSLTRVGAVGEETALRRIYQLVSGLKDEAGTGQFAKAIEAGTSEDYTTRMINEHGERQEAIQDRIARLIEQGNQVANAQLDAARQMVVALARLGVMG